MSEAKPKPLMLTQLRILFASIVAVAVGGAVAGLAFAVIEVPTQITHVTTADYVTAPATPMQMAASIAGLALSSTVVGLMFGGPVFLLAGLPVHGWLMRRGWTNILAYAALGAAVSGLVVTLTQAGVSGPAQLIQPSRWADLFSMAPYFALAGAIATSVFWLIRRPDRDPRLTSPANTPS